MPLSRIKPQMESSQLRLDSSAASTDVNERVLLNGVDSSSTGDGYAVILEDATANADTSQMLPQRSDGVLSFSEPPVELFTPVFKIFAGTNQAISDATTTVIQLGSTIGAYGAAGQDNANNFNTTHDFPTNLGVANFLDTSNYRVKPTIAGYYQINASARCGTNVDIHDFILYVRKNEVTHAVARMRHLGITNDDIASSAINVSDVIHFNGVDDYVEFYARLSSEDGSSPVINDGIARTYAMGHLLTRTS